MKKLVLLACLFSGLALEFASADVIYDNFGAGNAYETRRGYAIGLAENWEVGLRFDLSGGDYLLESIVVPIDYSAGTNQVTLRLYDSTNGFPGSIIEEATLSGLPEFGAENPLSTFLFSGKTILQDGQAYHLIANGANDSISSFSWKRNSIDDFGTVVGRSGGGSWNLSNDVPLPALRIHGTAIPEPCVLSLMILIVFIPVIRQRNSNSRVHNPK